VFSGMMLSVKDGRPPKRVVVPN